MLFEVVKQVQGMQNGTQLFFLCVELLLAQCTALSKVTAIMGHLKSCGSACVKGCRIEPDPSPHPHHIIRLGSPVPPGGAGSTTASCCMTLERPRGHGKTQRPHATPLYIAPGERCLVQPDI